MITGLKASIGMPSQKFVPKILPEKVTKNIQNKVNNLHFMDKRADKLARHFFSKKFLSGNNKYFRKRQQFAMRALIRNLNEGKNGGLIKLPTGTGKTFFFGNVIQALSCPSIILVPRENLVNGTYDELVGNAKKSGIGFDAASVHKIYGKEKGNTREQARALLEGGEFSGTLIITYQSFVRLCEADPELFQQLMKNVGCLISDEAHRSLGKKTSESINTAKGIKDEEFLEESEENEDIREDAYDKDAEAKAEQLIDEILKKKKMVHVHTTATPQLALKRVEEEIVYAATFGEVVIDGDLILPKQLSLGTAKTEVEGERITEKENKKGLDRFYFEDGTLVYEELTLQYMEQKEKNGGYLPTVAFCNTTEQAEFYVQYLLKEGIKAIQCTTNTGGTNYCDIPTSESKLESGEVDVIVTCSKVGEGWDLPTLRGVLWLVPSLSPARVMQGTGRITRIISEADIERLMELTGLSREYIEKTHQNTIVFSPNKWNYSKSTQKEDEGGGGGGGGGNKTSGGESGTGASLGDVYTGMELYGKYGELSMEQIETLGLDIDGLRLRISKEELFDMLWNYEGRSEQESYDFFMGMNAKEIKEFEIGGNKVTSLQKLSGIEVKGNVQTPSGFQEWIEKEFEGKKIEKQDKTLFIKLWSYKKSEQESYGYFMGLNTKEIQAFEIGGNKVRSLQKLSGIETKGNVKTPSGFQEWIEKVFEGKK